jgi:hypothetical protein
MSPGLKSDSQRSVGLASRIYAALTASASSFLLVLLLWPRPARTYVAESISVATSPGGPAASPAQIERWLLSDEVLRAAAINLRAVHPQHLAALCEAQTQDPVEALRSRVRVISLASPDESLRLAVVCRAGQRRAALSVASELSQQLVEYFPAQQKQLLEQAREERQRRLYEELRAALAAEQRLQVRLQGLRDLWLGSAALTALQSQAAPPSPAPAAESARAAELRRALGILAAERDRLLELFLPAHPQVQALEAQIRRLQDALDRQAPSDEAPATASGGQRHVLYEWGRSAAEAKGGAAPSGLHEVLGELTETQNELLKATHVRHQAEAAHQASLMQSSVDRGDMTWAASPARITEVSGDEQAHLRVASAVLAAAIGAVIAIWLGDLAQRDRPLLTSAELRASTALPVLATIAADGGEQAPAVSPSAAATCIRWLSRGSHIVLWTFAVTLSISVALDPGLAGDLAQEPLAAVGDLLWRIL